MAVVQTQQGFRLPTDKAVQKEIDLCVRLPDMFVLFLSGEPAVNPHYECVRKDSEQWLSSECHFDEQSRKRLTKTDFSYFCAVSAPDAGYEELRSVCDWGNWVFPFDDLFDNGGLKGDPERAQLLVDSLLAGMVEDVKKLPVQADHALVRVHNSGSPIGVRRRFKKAMQDYCMGTIAQVRNCYNGEVPSIEEMLALRQQSAGVSPLFALVEYAHKLNIPDHVFESRSIREIERLGVDFVLLQNDILSYCKEEKEGVLHNMVAICRQNGMSAQAAFNHIGNMLIDRYRDWYLALADLPTWGERIDTDVQEYIRGVQNIVRANINWSFRSKRYFGDMHERVRKTGIVTVRGQSADLELSLL